MDTIQSRLKKIQGQLQGIIKMYEDGRDCMEITQQITAVKRALSEVNLQLLEKETETCIINEDREKLHTIIKQIFKNN